MLNRKSILMTTLPILLAGCFVVAVACRDDGNEANDRLIGAECVTPDDCDDGNDDTAPLDCLTEFSGGYCGDASCLGDVDCPSGSVCVQETVTNYCFLTCGNKSHCNDHRSSDNEANCSSNVVILDGTNTKVCVPPSGS